MLTNLRDKKLFTLLTRKRSAYRTQNFAVQRGRLVERAHHVRRGDCALKRGGTFDGARDEFRLECLVFVFKGEDKISRIAGCVREALGAFFLQKCSQRLIAGLYDKLRDLRRRNSTGKLFVLRFDVSFREMTTIIQIVAGASGWARKCGRSVKGCAMRI